MVNINAYHQPGVEAGKKAAGVFLEILKNVAAKLTSAPQTAEQIATAINADPEDVHHCLTHLNANGKAKANLGERPALDTFTA